MASYDSDAGQFVQYYYDTFDSPANRTGLAAFYRDTSVLTFDGQTCQGVASITEKLTTGLPFQKVRHTISTLDYQPSSSPQQGRGGIVVVVAGAILVDDEQRPINYVHFFQLAQDGGNYFIQNDIFRLLMGLQ